MPTFTYENDGIYVRTGECNRCGECCKSDCRASQGDHNPGEGFITELHEDSIQAEIDSLKFNSEQQAGRIRILEKMMDTRSTPLWRRIVFRLDGWPSWTVIAEKPQWRPWRRWWCS